MYASGPRSISVGFVPIFLYLVVSMYLTCSYLSPLFFIVILSAGLPLLSEYGSMGAWEPRSREE